MHVELVILLDNVIVVKLRASRMSSAKSLVIQTAEGNHSFRMEHAALMALTIGNWVTDVDLVRVSSSSHL